MVLAPGDLTAMPAKTANISATIEIAAPPEQVWAVLADLASYPEWNPVFREVSGQLTPGKRITIEQHATGDRSHHDRQGEGADR